MWQRVWAKFGLDSADLEGFFSGPAFLAWQRMGNLRGWGGPLRQSFIDAQAGAMGFAGGLGLACVRFARFHTLRSAAAELRQMRRLVRWGSGRLVLVFVGFNRVCNPGRPLWQSFVNAHAGAWDLKVLCICHQPSHAQDFLAASKELFGKVYWRVVWYDRAWE